MTQNPSAPFFFFFLVRPWEFLILFFLSRSGRCCKTRIKNCALTAIAGNWKDRYTQNISRRTLDDNKDVNR